MNAVTLYMEWREWIPGISELFDDYCVREARIVWMWKELEVPLSERARVMFTGIGTDRASSKQSRGTILGGWKREDGGILIGTGR